MEKMCSKCGKVKPLSEFGKHKSRKDGVHSYCKLCCNEAVRKYRAENLEQERERVRKWQAEHPEQIRERERKYCAEHSEQKRDHGRKWRAEHPEYQRKRYAEHPEYGRLLEHTRRAREKGNGGKITAAEWLWLKEYYDFTCLKCERKEPEIKLELDHVIPIKLGGRNTIDNAQVLCKSCNCSKGAKHIDYRQPRAMEFA